LLTRSPPTVKACVQTSTVLAHINIAHITYSVEINVASKVWKVIGGNYVFNRGVHLSLLILQIIYDYEALKF